MRRFYGARGVASARARERGRATIDDRSRARTPDAAGDPETVQPTGTRARGGTNKVSNLLHDAKRDDATEKGGNKLGKIRSARRARARGARGGMGRREDAKTGSTVDALDGGGEKETTRGGDGGGGGT